MKKVIPFDIKYRPQIESGEYKVQTRCGENVRILDWNIHGDHPIVAEIWEEQDGVVVDESIRVDSFTTFGCAWANPPEDKLDDDLVLVTEEPEPELTEFEKCVYDLLEAGNGEYFEEDEQLVRVKEIVPDLLELAKKELYKDLPKWKKDEGSAILRYPRLVRWFHLDSGIDYYKVLAAGELYVEGSEYIPIPDLEKLPKEEEK